jgi:hypothetical protein
MFFSNIRLYLRSSVAKPLHNPKIQISEPEPRVERQPVVRLRVGPGRSARPRK